ncbi:putative zinc finger protein [Xylariaceae sp. FL1651]|nr:putative zinc finger protein [Xylariaceae sp. FL1651]
MAGHTNQLLFDKALGEFKEGLRRREIEDFKTTTLKELNTTIRQLQAKQHAQRRLQDLNRLQPFLKAIEQYGELVDRFYSNNEIVAFVWGPVKFLLQTTSIVDDAFCELLSAYERMGESLPLLMRYQDFFYVNPHMVKVLPLMYEDILKFQSIILRYFQQPQWQQVFTESWDTCKARFSGIILDIARRRSLIETEATPSQIEEVQDTIQQSRQIEGGQLDEKDLQRIRDVHNWLRAPKVEIDQNNHTKARAEYPGTGRWLLETTFFKEWFNPRFPTIPPLLWLNGIPGAGKTILASLVIEEARKLNPAPTVLFFYCKHDNSERDNFVALGRSLLAQFLKQDNGLLSTFYQKSCRGGEAVLTSPALVEELLVLAFGNCKSAYIILDGLDECPRDQRKYITQWFRKLVEDLPNSEPERLRCLFVSQDDGIARKDFAGLASITIRPEDSTHDIKEYSQIEANKLQESCSLLTKEKVSMITSSVANSAGGLFLLAKLIWINLSGHTSIARLEEELEPGVFPKTIYDAYRRIMRRMAEQAPKAARDDALRLLGWLVCAKRPLKWHEIQAMNSINLEEQRIALDRQSFIKSPKDLCASLVETRSDGTVELVHLTAKLFLLENYFSASEEELKLATLCIDYLNLPACVDPPTVEQVLNGNYGFMDYAVIYWLRHLEAGVTLETDKDKPLMEQLAESLGVFINQHWAPPRTALTLAKRHSDKLQFFKSFPFYDQLEQVVASTRRHLKFFGDMKKEEIGLNLVDIVHNVRDVLEDIVSGATDPTDQKTVDERYGTNLFKCPRFSCQFFTTGFPSENERKKHISRHERPFQCSEEQCLGYIIGFASAADCEKHVRKDHFTAAIEDEEFPTDQDVERSIVSSCPVVDQDQDVELDNQDENIEDSTASLTGLPEPEPEPEPESEPELPQLPRQKRPRQTEFKCPHCHLPYKKRYNLQSHLRTHEIERSHTCVSCNKEFARLSDYRRHLGTHTGMRNFVCRGYLANGNTWGCGKSFARAETLRKHHESRVGRACIQPLQQQ